MVLEFKNTSNQSSQIQNRHQFYWLFQSFNKYKDIQKIYQAKIQEKAIAPGQQELQILQSMINTQYSCNRCKYKVEQVYYCHDQEDGICYTCSKQKDKCSICNKKSNIPVKSSSKCTRSSIKQNCNFCEKELSVSDKHIKTQCKHLICTECILKKIRYLVKSYKNAQKDQQENPILRIKCSCLRSQNINLQQFLRENCFCCGETLEKNNYEQLLFGLRIAWSCKAILSPTDFRNCYNQEEIIKNDIQKLSKTQKNHQSFQQSKQKKQQQFNKSNKQEKIENRSIKKVKIQKNQQQYKNSFDSYPQKQQNKAIDKEQNKMLFCQSCDCSSERCSLILVDDSFYLCSSCQFKSKSYQSTHKKTIKQQYSLKDERIIETLRQSTNDKDSTRKSRRIFKNDLFYEQQQSSRQQQSEKIKRQKQFNIEGTCLSCQQTFSLSSNSNTKVQSQISDIFCPQCIEINHKIIKKQEQPQSQVKRNRFFSSKSLKDTAYSEYLKQIIILQSPQTIQEPSQLSLKRRPIQQNKDRRAIYSVVEEFPEFQQLQIVIEQGQTSHCYNCKLFSYKSNLIDCSQRLKKKSSMACKMCFLILYEK